MGTASLSEAAAATGPAQPAEPPSVTVITATLGNRADLLAEVLGAIRAQDYPGRIECIVVLDNRSADAAHARTAGQDPGQPQPGQAGESGQVAATREVAVAAGARVLDNERSPGLAGARNTGIMAATTELVAFCDDDDSWRPGKLRAQVAALTAEPAAALVCCGITIDYDGKLIPRVHPRHVVTFRELLKSRLTALHVSTFVARRAMLLDGVGLVSEEIPGSRAEDYEFMLRAARHGPVLNVPQPLVNVLWHTQRPQMYGRWPLVLQALPWLLDHYPEFRTVPAGYARIAGQVAFAHAAAGNRAEACRWVLQTIRASVLEPRAYLTLAVASGLVKPGTVLRELRRRGRGI